MPVEAKLDHCFVVPTYRENPFLPDCLKSLRGQSQPSTIIITTPTPSPFIFETAARFGVEVLVNPSDGGIAANWNFALNASRARYVTLAHQDDVYFPEFLRRTLSLFARHRGAALAFTGYSEIDDQGNAVDTKVGLAKGAIERLALGESEVIRSLRLRNFLAFGNALPCSSVTFDRNELPDFEFSSAFSSNLDWEAWWRLSKQGKTFLRCREKLVGRRYNSLTTTSDLLRTGLRQAEDLMMFERFWPKPISDMLAYVYRAGY